MQMRRTDSLIEVLLSEPELNKYNVTVEQMAQHKPFPSKIIEDLMEKAASEFHMEFDYYKAWNYSSNAWTGLQN